MQQASIDLLVLAAKRGNRQAFGKLYDHFLPGALRFAYKLCGSSQLAQDAVQDAWLSCARSLIKIDDPRMFRSWLYRTVRWRVVDQQRKQFRHEPLPEPETAAIPDLNQTAAVESQELRTMINALPELERQAIHLFYLEQLTLQEIAVILEVPVGTMKSRLNRARRHLREQLESGENHEHRS